MADDDVDLLDPQLVCRDDDCEIEGIHRCHLIRKIKPDLRHRPDKSKSDRLPWLRDDVEGLAQSVEKAAANGLPMYPAAILRDVRDDYGAVHERTVYRHLKRLVALGRVIKLDLGLAFAVYIAPKARALRDPTSIREYMVGVVDQHPLGKNRRKARRQISKRFKNPAWVNTPVEPMHRLGYKQVK